MNRKISLGICLSLVIISIAATYAVTMISSKQIYNRIISNISQRSQTYDSVDEISKIVSNYFYGTADDFNTINASLADGYVNGLGDKNSRYLNAEDYAAYTERLKSGVTGIGIETTYNYDNDSLVITYVYSGSPAEKSGLMTGDEITAVNAIAVNRKNYSLLKETFYGSKLTSVKIDFERADEKKSAEPLLGFSIPSVIGRMEGSVGYIKISGFYKNTADEFKSVIETLKSNGAKSIVFDVRNTYDGTVEYAVQVIDVIVPAIQGNIAVAKDKTGSIYKDKVFTAEYSSISMPYAVLVNGNTSGPAELFACDMRDISQANIIGTKTAGVGTLQEIFTLENGGAVLLTVALIEPKGGESSVYNEIGITPAIEVISSFDDSNLDLIPISEDNQLSTALNILAS